MDGGEESSGVMEGFVLSNVTASVSAAEGLSSNMAGVDGVDGVDVLMRETGDDDLG